MDMPLWFSNLLFWSLQVGLLVLAAAFLAALLELRQPHVLLAYWRSLLAVSLLLPLLQPWHRPPAIPAPLLSVDFDVPLPSVPVPAHWHLPSLQTLAPILGIIILAGIALRFVILAVGLLKLRRLRQTSRPIETTAESAAVLQAMRALFDAPAEFRLSSQVDSPVTFGLVAPVVLLPDRFPTLELRFQSAIACHELLHVRRRDWAHHLVEEAGRALFWFHPAIAWLISRVRLAREQVVDLEVIRLTNARKSYLEALLEFTNGRTGLAAIPAPPFLAERQLVERVALMLKEVRMSQRRLIVSLALISSCLALVIALAAWTFPLKAAPRALQNAPQGGVSGGVEGGITGGVAGGVSSRNSQDVPTVYNNTIWVDTVKRGPMVRQVRGLGTLVRDESSGQLLARITLPEVMVSDIRTNRSATIQNRSDLLVKGHVVRLDAEVLEGNRAVYVALDSAPAAGVSAGTEIDGTIDIEKIDNVLHVGRPMNAAANSEANLFKLSNDGSEAVRTTVKLGRASVNTIEILDGLQEGDKVILSDMSSVGNAARIRLIQDASQPQTTHQEKPASYPSCRYCPNPDYPEEARKAKISSAKVVLQVSVLESGDVDPQDIRVLKDPGNGFADKAISAVKTWKMKPATLSNGTPVKISVPVEVSFQMKTK